MRRRSRSGTWPWEPPRPALPGPARLEVPGHRWCLIFFRAPTALRLEALHGVVRLRGRVDVAAFHRVRPPRRVRTLVRGRVPLLALFGVYETNEFLDVFG